jgi:hypothetical protein
LLAGSGVVRVGEIGLPTSLDPVTLLIDDFNEGNLSEYIKTVVNDGSAATPNVSFSVNSGALIATYAGTSTHEQLVFLRDDVSLDVGETLIVDVAMGPTSQQMDFGLAISATATPGAADGTDTDTRDSFDWASVAIRPSQNNIRVNQSVNGVVNTATGAMSGISETVVAALYITRSSATQFTLGYADTNSVFTAATVVNTTATDVATAIGFYADLRSGGSLGTFDNLRILGFSEMMHGQKMDVEGDVSLNAGSRLEFDVYSSAVADLLDVTGNLNAAGTLVVTLSSAAPQPMPGDRFDILNFSSASGSFDIFDLPLLPSGFAWNVSNILSTGELEVVTDVDLDNDGDVDGRDFLLIQRINPLLIAAWRAQYGNQVAVTLQVMTARVPEPSMSALWSIGMSIAVLGRWSFVPA